MEENEHWLAQHGLSHVRPTPVIAARLAVRRRARLVTHIMLAGLFMVAALVQTSNALHRDEPLFFALLGVTVGALLATQLVLDGWVRRVDRRMGATLSRRATHPVHPGWREVLGRPYAGLALGSFVGAEALAVSALAVSGSPYAAWVLLAGVSGVGALAAVNLRHLLTRPVVADDEATLTADVVMRIEDARDATVPSVLWSLPLVLQVGMAPVWWGAAAFAFVVFGVVALVLVQARAPDVGAVARGVVGVR